MNKRSCGSGGEFHQRLQFGDQPELCDGERAELNFKPDNALGRGLDRATYSARSLIFRNGHRNTSQGIAKKKRAGADRRICDDDIRCGKSGGTLK